MTKFETWLRTEPRTMHLFVFMPWIVLCILTYNYILLSTFSAFGIDLIGTSQPERTHFVFEGTFFKVLKGFIVASIIEEGIFRLPLLILVSLRVRFSVLMAVVVASSAIFGYLHGGFGHILIQGMLGFVLSLTLLKVGGMHGGATKPYVAVILTHTFYNLLIYLA